MPNPTERLEPTLIRYDGANAALFRSVLHDAPDLPDDLLAALREPDEALFAICAGETVVGAAVATEEADALLIVDILPPYRGRGYGRAAALLAEAVVFAAGAGSVTTAYRPDCAAGAALARSLGYERRFSSAYLVCRAHDFPRDKTHMRAYTDADFPVAQSLSARAFHQMRLRVGDFPNSVVAEPTEQMRAEWAQSAEQRRVWVENGAVVGVAKVSKNELESLAVAPERQGRGIGRRFLCALCAEICDGGFDEIALYCVVGNPARRLYESVGFVEAGTDVYAVKTRG